MPVEDLQQLCHKFPGVTEDVKWGHDLCFSVGGKIFFIVGLDQSPVSCSFKVKDEEFEEFSSREGFKPAPYLGRYKWVFVDDIERFSPKEWEQQIKESYDLIKMKLSPKIRKQLGL